MSEGFGMAAVWLMVCAVVGVLLAMRYRFLTALAASLVAAGVGAALAIDGGWTASVWAAVAAWIILQASYLVGALLNTVVVRKRLKKR